MCLLKDGRNKIHNHYNKIMGLYFLNLCMGQGQDIQMPYKNKMVNAKRTKFSIVDGDTIRLNRALNGNNFVRLVGVDAPELNARAGHKAKEELKQMLRGKNITVQTVGKSYGRNVAVVR